MKILRELIQIAILALIIFVIVHSTMGTYDIRMSSMEPNVSNGVRVVVNKATYFHLNGGWGKLIFWGDKQGNVTYMFPMGGRET